MVAIVVCCDVYLQRGRYRPSHDLGAEYLAIMSLAGSEGEKLFFPPADDGYGDSIDLAMVRRYLQPTSEWNSSLRSPACARPPVVREGEFEPFP